MSFGVSQRRPGGVTLIVVLTVISGLGSLIGGAVVAALHKNARLIKDSHEPSKTLLVIGIASAVVGLIYLIVARGLARGNGFSRFLVGLVSLVSLGGGAYLAATKHGHVQDQAIAQAAIGLVILLLVYSPKANAFFRSH